MLAVVVPELYFHLRRYLRVLSYQIFKIFFSNCQATQRLRYLIEKQKALLVANFETSNFSAHAKTFPEEKLVIDLVADLVSSLLNKKYLRAIVKLPSKHLIFFVKPNFE